MAANTRIPAALASPRLWVLLALAASMASVACGDDATLWTGATPAMATATAMAMAMAMATAM
jgi:hypothetical protein